MSIFIVAATLGCSVLSPGPPSAARDIAEFERRLESIQRELQIPGMSAAIARDDRIIWSRGFGVTDVAARTPVSESTAFHAASLTKTFAATIIMQLVQQGRISLDAPAAEYGVGLPTNVRVRHLLSMTSEGTPGEAFKYNGDRFGELDRVIRAASGRGFAQLLADSIIHPLGLSRTAPNLGHRQAFSTTGFDPDVFGAGLAKPYALKDGRVIETAYPAYFGTTAGLISSAEDLARFSISLDQGKLLTPSTKATMFAPVVGTRGDTLPYALGWFSQTFRGKRVVWAYGYWTGNSSLLIKVPDSKLTFVLMANSDQLSARYPLGAGKLLESAPARLFLDTWVFASTTPL